MNESLEKCKQIKNADLSSILDKAKEATKQEDLYDVAMIYAMAKYGQVVTRPDNKEEYTIFITEEDLEKAFDELSFELASYIGEVH